MTKLKVLQLGILVAFIGALIFYISPYLGLNEITNNYISNVILIMIVLIWVSSYIFRVVNGKMTFMEQRKRYREVYEKKFNDNLEKKFESLSSDEQKKLLEKLEEK